MKRKQLERIAPWISIGGSFLILFVFPFIADNFKLPSWAAQQWLILLGYFGL